jgi:hypothetical protein
MAGSLTISYGSDSVSFTKFSGDDLPGSVLGQANLEFSQIGLGYATGPARTQRKIWAVATYATSAEIVTLNTIFTAWDTDRSTSLNTAVVNVVDNLLSQATGNSSIPTVTTTAFFTTAPSVSLVGRSNEIFLLSFGLTEV